MLPAAASAKKPKCNGERATIVGTNKADRIEATREVDVIVAGGGRDRIVGVDQRDLVCAGAGKDRIAAVGGQRRGGSRRASVARGGFFPAPLPSDGDWALGPGDDRLKLTCPMDRPRDFFHAKFPTIQAEGGDDTIIDDCRLAEWIVGGPGDDRIVGGAGHDAIYGSEGNDTIIDRFSTPRDCDQNLPPKETWPPGSADRRCVRIAEGLYQSTEDLLVGGEGNDRIFAGEANDSVAGDAGDDVLFGGNGQDFIVGGDGVDRCDGGPGADSNRLGDPTPVEDDCESAVSFEEDPPPPPRYPRHCSRGAYLNSSSGLAECMAHRPRLATLDWSPEEISRSALPTEIVVDAGIDESGAGGVGVTSFTVRYQETRDEESFSSTVEVPCPRRAPGSDGLIHCRGTIPMSGSTRFVWLEQIQVWGNDDGSVTYAPDDLNDPVLFSPRPAPGGKSTMINE